jgi:uncharacterized membrane protein YhdT
MKSVNKKRSDWSAWYLLFVLEFGLVLWPPFYNRMDPTLFGMPFFYWYQLGCVLVGALFTAIVYFRTRP